MDSPQPPNNIVSYATPGRHRRISVRAVLVYLAIFFAAIYLLVFQLDSYRLNSSESDPWDEFEDIDCQLRSLKMQGRNIELHLEDPDPLAHHAAPFTLIYYAANYIMYPNHVYVGSDDQIINFPSQLKQSDHLPSPQWMKDHRVSAVAMVYGTGLLPSLRVVPLP